MSEFETGVMTDVALFKAAYNAHEGTEAVALDAMVEHLRGQSVETLSCLCDPQWRWETRSSLSVWIVDLANEVLDEKLEALVAV